MPLAAKVSTRVVVAFLIVLFLIVVTGSTLTTQEHETRDKHGLLWEGGFDSGAIPPGANGRSCGTGARDESARAQARMQYGSVEEMGNSRCTSTVSLVDGPTRTPDSRRALKVRLGSNQQREQLQSTYTWVPDDTGTVDQWYGFSMLYASDWGSNGVLGKEVSDGSWHNPIAFRMQGDNGSLNLSGDTDLDNADGRSFRTFAEPHLILRRNTVKNEQGFYRDGRGLDKLDLGPVVVNRWMDVVCHIRWSTTAKNALRACWRDGDYMGARTTLNAVSDETHFLRVGQYQTTEISHPRTSYFDNVRIGTSYEAVDPSRQR